METASIEPTRRKNSKAPYIVGAILLIVLVAIGIWVWVNRPIEAVELSQAELARAEEKLEVIQAETAADEYVPGEKEIVFTERELNGLLNENTTLGESLRLELRDGEVHARLETDLDPDLPILGGKKLKARAKLSIKQEGGRPSLVLDDLTVWGASLPNDWLAGLKGKDLLSEVFGNGSQGLPGVEELLIKDGQLLLRLAE